MSNPRNAGRPSMNINLKSNHVEETINEVLKLCSNQKTKEIVLSFCKDVMESLDTSSSTALDTSSSTAPPVSETMHCKSCQTSKLTPDQIFEFIK